MLTDAAAEGQGCIALTATDGNWEQLTATITTLGEQYPAIRMVLYTPSQTASCSGTSALYEVPYVPNMCGTGSRPPISCLSQSGELTLYPFAGKYRGAVYCGACCLLLAGGLRFVVTEKGAMGTAISAATRYGDGQRWYNVIKNIENGNGIADVEENGQVTTNLKDKKSGCHL